MRISSRNRYYLIIAFTSLVEHQQPVELFVAQYLCVALLSDPAALVMLALTPLFMAHVAARWKLRAV